MIPGSNLLKTALRFIGTQSVQYYAYAGTTTNAAGLDTVVYSPGVQVNTGSVQAVPRGRYTSMGLDFTKDYVTWFVVGAVFGIERDRANDKFSFAGKTYDVVSVTPWYVQDGWVEVLGVYNPEAITVMGTPWATLEDIPLNVQGLESLATSGLIIRKSDGDIVTPTNYFFVESVSDLPEPIGGVILIPANATVFFSGVVDLAGARLECEANVCILGGSSENSRIISTGLSGQLITSQYSIPIRSITLEADTIFNLDAGELSGQAIDWFGVNLVSPNVGRIANYSNVIMTDCALLNAANLVFDGTINTIGFSQCLFQGADGQRTIIGAPTLTIARRFRAIYSAFVTPNDATGIDMSASATVPTEGYILDTINFTNIGNGQSISGVPANDNKTLFVNCVGVNNSSAIANYTMANNATPTDIVSQSTPVKVSGVTVGDPITSKFVLTNNRATYAGGVVRNFFISAVATVVAAAQNLQVGLYVTKNGVTIDSSEIYGTTNANFRAEPVYVQAFATLSPGDYIEIWAENGTNSTDITVSFLNVAIRAA